MSVSIMVHAHHDLGGDRAVLMVDACQFADVVFRNAADGRSGGRRILRYVTHGVFVDRLHLDAVHLAHSLELRRGRFAERHCGTCGLVPHGGRINHGRLAGQRVGIALRRLYAQVAHAQEHAVFLDEQAGVGPVAERVLLDPAVLDQHVENTQGQGAVGAGLDGNPPIGLCRVCVVHRVDDDVLRAVLLGLHEEVHGVHERNGRIVSPDNLRLRILAVGQFVPQINATRRPLAAEADSGVNVQKAAVRTTERVHEALIGSRAVARPAQSGIVARAQKEHNGGRPVLAGVLLPLLHDGVHGLVPADAFEFARATFSDAFHGILQAFRTVNAMRMRKTLRADAIVGSVRQIPCRGAHHLPITNMHVQKAPAEAVPPANARIDLVGRLGGDRFDRLLVVRLRRAAHQRASRAQHGSTLDEVATSEPPRLRCLSHVTLLLSFPC